MSRLRLVVPLLLLAAASALPAADGPSALLLALNKGDHTLAIVDAATLEVLGKAPSGPDPHEVIGSADGTLAFITNYTVGNLFANSLSVVDLTARKALPPIDLGALSRPHGLALAGGKVYFTAEGSRSIGRYDPSSGKIDWTLSTGQDGTHMVVSSRDLRQLFTSNLGSASVCIIERGSVTVVPVGRGAEGFDLSPDGRQLWVANAQDATVSIIDTAAKKVTATLNVPFRRANRLKFTPDGKRVLISDLGGTHLFVLDTTTRTVATQIDLGGGAAGIEVAPDGSRVFVSVGSRNSVAVVDVGSLSVTSRIETGPGPDGLAWVQRR